jgi:hypothetical protein
VVSSPLTPTPEMRMNGLYIAINVVAGLLVIIAVKLGILK